MPRRFAILASVVTAVFLVALYMATLGKREGCQSGKVAGGAIGGEFTLLDENGATVTDKDVITGPTLIYFGYTFCPDVCPFDVIRNAEAVDLLEQRGHVVKPVFITVDADRDTPEVMREFTENIHPRMQGLTGSKDQIKTAAKAYKAYYKAHDAEPNQEEFYLVDHSTFTYLITPDGFLDFFRREETPQQMADQVQCLLEENNS